MASLLETLRSSIKTSLYGRRVGLDNDGYLVGPPSIKVQVEDITTTSATTASAYGYTKVSGLASSQGPVQHNLPHPVVGVEKTLILACTSTGSQQFLCQSGESIVSASDGSTKALINLLGPGGSITLVGVTTSQWAVRGGAGYSSTALAQNVSYTTST